MMLHCDGTVFTSVACILSSAASLFVFLVYYNFIAMLLVRYSLDYVRIHDYYFLKIIENIIIP